MSDLRDLQEILVMLKNQETLIGLMEEQQTENETDAAAGGAADHKSRSADTVGVNADSR